MDYRALVDALRTRVVEIDPTAVAADPPDVLIDIREPEERATGRIPGALEIPRGTLEMTIETAVPDRSSRIVLYCSGGHRSILAARTLGELGYEHVASLAGGYDAWKAAGLPSDGGGGLSIDQRIRYDRHLRVPEIGEKGQLLLLESSVLVVGAGGLGSPAAMYLAAAGVGRIGLVDDDTVDLSNLQRQILHDTTTIGRRKVDSGGATLRRLNPDVEVVTHPVRLGADNVLDLLDGYDVVVDAADNFPTRYLLNDAALKAGVPVVHGSVYRLEGQVTVFDATEGPCYRCLYPLPPPPELAPSCAEAGVIGSLPGVIGSIQAVEAVKLLVGIGDPLRGRLLLYDAAEQRFTELSTRRDPHCRACGIDRSDIVLVDYDPSCAPRRPGDDRLLR